MNSKILFAMAMIVLVGCKRETEEIGVQSLSTLQPRVLVEQPILDLATFNDATIRVVDDQTLLAIEGAEVHVLCLGGTPHADSHDTTDSNGLATIMCPDREMILVSVQFADYDMENRGVSRSNPLIRLRRSSR